MRLVKFLKLFRRECMARPALISNPPNKAIYPEWWKDGKNLMRLHPSYKARREYEKKQKQSK